jgi:hypothetical protein
MQRTAYEIKRKRGGEYKDKAVKWEISTPWICTEAWGLSPRILNFGVGWKKVLSFATQSLYPWEKKIFHSLCLIAASNGGRSPYLWVPELYPASGTSFSQKQLIKTEPKHFSKSLTDPSQYIGTDRVENTFLLLQCNCCRVNTLVCGAFT